MKRVYNEDGTKSTPAWLMATLFFGVSWFILPLTFVIVFCREVGSAFWYACNAVMQEIESAKRTIRSAR